MLRWIWKKGRRWLWWSRPNPYRQGCCRVVPPPVRREHDYCRPWGPIWLQGTWYPYHAYGIRPLADSWVLDWKHYSLVLPLRWRWPW